MSAKTPKIQPAIRFLEFKVISVNFDAGDQPSAVRSDEVLIDFAYGFGFDPVESQHYVIQFQLVLSEKRTDFRLAVEAMAYFESKEPIDEAFKKSAFVKQNSPAMAFPYLRAFVSTFTTNAGVNPIVLPTYNFAK
jgi:preprotein translocase subunit SecB